MVRVCGCMYDYLYLSLTPPSPPSPRPPSRCDTDETATGEIRFAAPWGSTPAAAVLHTYVQIHTNELKHTPIHAHPMIVHAQRLHFQLHKISFCRCYILTSRPLASCLELAVCVGLRRRRFVLMYSFLCFQGLCNTICNPMSFVSHLQERFLY
jgi:hypothetical protein